MRVIIGSESFYPNVSGVAIAAWNLASYLASQGHQVLVLAPSIDETGYHDQCSEGFNVYRLPSVPNPFRKGFRVTLHPLQKVKSIVEEWQPQIIHLQDPTSIGSCLVKAAQDGNIPVIISHHFTLEYVLSYLRFLKPLHKRSKAYVTRVMIDFYNTCQHVICPSETVKHWLISAGVQVPVTVVSNGVDLSRFFSFAWPSGIRSDLQLPNLPIVLYVGRLDLDKNLETLMQAIPVVLKKHPAHFVFCGGGNLLKRLRRQSEHLGLSSNITFLGQLDHQSDDLPRLYQIATCFVIPSACETQSIVTMEAMASGIPIVAAAAGALPELVSDGENGYLFTPNNPAEMAKKIGLILADPELAQKMGRSSLEKIIAHEMNHNLQRVEQIYNGVLKHEEK